MKAFNVYRWANRRRSRDSDGGQMKKTSEFSMNSEV